jgi:signal transduction histidine kinase
MRRMRRPAIAVLAGVATAAAITFWLATPIGDSVEDPARDAALRLLPSRPASSTAVIAIDETSLRALGPWPWSRDELARIVDRAANEGARAVILDILLAESRPGDEGLARALGRVPSVAVAVLDEQGQWLGPAATLGDIALGHGNFEIDRDGIVRRFATTKQSSDRSLSALSIEAARFETGAAVQVGRSIAPAFRTRPRSIPTLSAISMLRRDPLPIALRGRLVFIGPTAFALGDRVLTPVSPNERAEGETPADPGVTVHAAAAESLVRGEEIHRVPPIAAGALAGLAVGAIVHARRSRRRRLSVSAFSLALLLFGGMGLLAGAGIAVPFLAPLASIILAALGVELTVLAISVRRGGEALSHMASGLGIPDAGSAEVGMRIHEIAALLAERRGEEAESKRVLAHELKTPLASIRGLTQLVGGFDLSEVERRRVASLLESEAGKLQSMVHALLDLERLAMRDFQDSTTVFDLGALVAARVEFLRMSTDRQLVLAFSPVVAVRGDVALLERVVDNLVGNALKYSEEPFPVVVRVSREPEAAVLEVEDRGPGITAEDSQRIFQRFFRGSTAAGTEGLGLGLSLVGEVARWHGGSISVQQAPQGGSRFRFTLPLAEAALSAGGI